MPSPVKIALVQLLVSANRAVNLERAGAKVKQAAQAGARLVVLPECFNSSYGTQYFDANAEPVVDSKTLEPTGDSTKALSAMAAENNVFLVGGSIPERDTEGGLYNTSTVWSPQGKLLAIHRKVHLFDIDIPGKIRFKESEVLSSGNKLTHFETPWGKFGLGICYDVRFPELAMIAARQEGCKGMIYPGAFNMTTGPLHWQLLARARALDNQFFVAMCSPARDTTASYVAYGHSTVIDPMGQVIAEADEKENIVYAELNLDEIEAARSSIPCNSQRRFDVYSSVSSNSGSVQV
ncbi:nitrilase 2 [Ramicandelaber brevisporus]|nr:nitrilase 2 [Ramicandelaber brevisporus]